MIDYVIYTALVALLVLQIYALLRSKSLPKYRLWVRLGLNTLLWLVLLLYVIQPQWTWRRDTKRVLLISENIPAPTIQKVKDSLQITESFSVNDFKNKVAEDPAFISQLGAIYLFGQDFSPELLSHLSEKPPHWLPIFQPNELKEIHWKAMLRKGEFQEVTGKLELAEPNFLKLKFANRVLDSIMLPKGLQTFHLRFPAFAIGRTETTLELGNQTLQKIAFYARNPPINSILFLLENPDFESKTLAEWLGKNGNQVEMRMAIAKNTQSKVSINLSEHQKIVEPDIIITDPTNTAHSLVKKAIANGKSVLLYNITNLEQAIKNSNATFGTKWRVKKITNELSIAVGKGVTALPYRLEENPNQKTVKSYPVAVQKVSGHVGISLLNETFPLKLSGDSLAYQKIWSGIFQLLQPPFKNNIEAQAPLWQATQSHFLLNNFESSVNELQLANDTVQLHPSSINPLTTTAHYIFRKTGWQPLQDSLEVYVEESPSTAFKAKQIQEILQAYKNTAATNSVAAVQGLTVKLPDWAWLVLFILCFTAVWIEPKLRF